MKPTSLFFTFFLISLSLQNSITTKGDRCVDLHQVRSNLNKNTSLNFANLEVDCNWTQTMTATGNKHRKTVSIDKTFTITLSKEIGGEKKECSTNFKTKDNKKKISDLCKGNECIQKQKHCIDQLTQWVSEKQS